MNHRSFVIFLLLTGMAARGADEVRSTQEELRRRNVFFGDIDGRRSGEYAEAVSRYQRRKGLAVSGQEDRDTLRSLGLLPRSPNEAPPKELAWPAEPVLKSDAHFDAEASAGKLAAETGIDNSGPTGGETAAGGAETEAPGSATSARTRPAAAPARVPSKLVPSARLSFRNRAAIPGEVTKIVQEYLHAVGHNRLEDELHFYADRVDYFGSRQVDRRIIEQTLRGFYQHWPKRKYALAGSVGYRLLPARGEIVLTYRVKFSHGDGRRRVQGQTENRLTINAATADPRIVAIEEKRVRP